MLEWKGMNADEQIPSCVIYLRRFGVDDEGVRKGS